MTRIAHTCLLLLLILPVAAPAQEAAASTAAESTAAEKPGLRRFEVSQATSEIRIDAVLDEPAWADALVIDLPYEWFPGDNVEPPVRTECLVTYSKRTLYVAFRASDPEPGKIRAHLMDRDNMGSFSQDDHVGIQIDTFDAEREALQFRSNPLGVQVDGTFNDVKGEEDFAWDAIWDNAARITADGYVVEMAVPFQQLRFPRTAEVQTWGFEAFRNYPRGDRHRISSKFTDRDSDCTLCQENKVTGFVGLTPGLNLEVVPTVTTTRTDQIESFPDGGLAEGDEEVEPGLDVRWSITPNTALNAAANPDFSQVEADAAQLEVNTRFALFFPEKRPLFLEGADFFETPIQAVFTRTVADPRWAAKLTGKEGPHSIGAFIAEDDVNNLIIASNQRSFLAQLDDQVLASVVRYRRDVGAQSTLGVLYTGRDGTGYHNRVAGLDGFVRFNQSNSIKLQYLSSDTEYPEELATAAGQPEGSFDGDAIHLSFLHRSRAWVATAEYEDIDRDFRADSGFVPRVDLRSLNGMLEYRIWGERDDWYRRVTFGVFAERIEDQDGLVTDEGVNLFATMNGPLQSFADLTIGDREELFLGERFDTSFQELFYQIKPTGRANLAFQVRNADAIDFTNVQPAEEFSFTTALQFRLGRHVDWTLQHQIQTLDVDGGELFEVNLAQTEIVYQFNVRTFVRGIFQYQTIDRDPSLYTVPVDGEDEDLFTQLLFSYKINPRTVLFAGYSDNRFGFDDISLTQIDRTLFLKLSYAFLF